MGGYGSSAVRHTARFPRDDRAMRRDSEASRKRKVPFGGFRPLRQRGQRASKERRRRRAEVVIRRSDQMSRHHSTGDSLHTSGAPASVAVVRRDEVGSGGALMAESSSSE